MGRYTGNPAKVEALIRPTQVHRDVYIDDEVFDLEMKHLLFLHKRNPNNKKNKLLSIKN